MNVEFDEKKNTLTVTIPCKKKRKLSKSGKSFILASTNGNVETDLEIDGEVVVLGLNAFYENPDYEAPPKSDE